GEAGLGDRGGDRALLRGREIDAATVGLEVAVAEAVDEADLRARLVEVLLRGIPLVRPEHGLVVLGHLAVRRIGGDAGRLRGHALLAGALDLRRLAVEEQRAAAVGQRTARFRGRKVRVGLA